ncbi:MAG: ADOP family duplicated permease [Vicinamibacterales bacterium]
MSRLLHDARLALRRLLASPGYTALVVGTLALGIGVNTAVFSVLDSILLRPVPYVDADRIGVLWARYSQGQDAFFSARGGFDTALVNEWRRQTDLFDRVEAYEPRSFVFEDEHGAEMISGSVVTPGLMALLGVPPAQGRWFTEADGAGAGGRVAIVSDRFWRERLGGVTDAAGVSIVLDGRRYAVVGVMPADFRYPDEAQQVWLPADPTDTAAANDGSRVSFVPTVRLTRGLAWDDVAERVIARGPELNRVAGATTGNRAGAELHRVGRVFDERTERSLVVLAGAVVFLLLLVCANVANVTLARTIGRARDAGVRAALGASRLDLVRETAVEYVLLGLVSAAAGILVTVVALGALVAVLPEEMTRTSLNAIDLDGRALAALAVTAALTVVAFGLPPALVSSRASIALALGAQGRSVAGSRGARRLRATLIVAEVVLSIVLLVGAALMMRSVLKLQAIDTGVDPRGLITLQLALPAPAYADATLRDGFTRDLVDRLRRQPDVGGASAGSLPPDASEFAYGGIEFADRPGERTPQAFVATYDAWPGFFETTGIRLLEGRGFRAEEPDRVAIVSEGFAAKHWPGRSAVGARFRFGDQPWRTVVGVAAEVRRISEDADPNAFELYYPPDQLDGMLRPVRPLSTIAEIRTIVVRTSNAGRVAPLLGGVVHAVDPRVVVSRVSLVEHTMLDSIARSRVVLLMMSVFAGFGLVMAAAGLYGVLSHLVVSRRREIGIRIALGANRGQIGRLVFGRGLALALAGVAIGVPVALALVRTMRTLLYEVDAADPVAVLAVAGLLLVAAAAASWWPARRAMQVDPMTLFRDGA